MNRSTLATIVLGVAFNIGVINAQHMPDPVIPSDGGENPPSGQLWPDSVASPRGGLQWVIAGAVIGGGGAWCLWNAPCSGGNDLRRTTFSVAGAAAGSLVGYLFGNRFPKPVRTQFPLTE